MGSIYEVEHRETCRRRALKVMHPHLAEQPELRERFRLEARITADVESDFIVDVLDAGVDEATRSPFLVMEMLRGHDLADHLAREGRLSSGDVLRYLEQTAKALDQIHRASIVHRDLKPGNLFLCQRPGREPVIKVLDFGVAKVLAGWDADRDATPTVGTPHYMAPEQFRGGPVSPAIDVYAVGMIAFTLLVGDAYWAEESRGSDNFVSFALAASDGPSELASARAARRGVALPTGFDAWFAQTAAARPDHRFARASEAVRALADVFDRPIRSLATPILDMTYEGPPRARRLGGTARVPLA